MQLFRLKESIPLYRINGNRINYFGIKLVGSNWIGNNTHSNLLMGFTNVSALDIANQWLTSNFRCGFELRWEGGNDKVQKALYGRFASGISAWNYGATNVTGIRTGTLTDNVNQNDVILCYFNPSTGNFTLEWRDSTAGYALKSTGTIQHPDGIILKNNFNSSELVPIFSQFDKNINWDIEVLSGRDIATLGITVASGESIFY